MNDKKLKEIGDTAAKTAQKKRRRPDLSEAQTVHTEPGDNRAYINHSLRLAALPKVCMQDADAVDTRVTEYFQICAEDDMKPSVAGLALALDIDRRYLWELREGKKGNVVAVSDTLKKAMRVLDLQMVDYMQNGRINPVSGIFLMKNNFGYQDKQEVVVTPKNPLGDAETPQALADRYINLDPVALPSASDDGE